MRINQINNSNFKGIKLSSNDYYKTREIAQKLENQGYYCLGHKTIFCNNTNADKINLGQQIRNKAHFFDDRFGAIFLPWSQEAYLMSTPQNEQKIYNLVREYDEGACINLAI